MGTRRFLLPIQFFFSLIILVFCIFQIQQDNKNITIYWGGVTSILGYWLPSPMDNNKDE